MIFCPGSDGGGAGVSSGGEDAGQGDWGGSRKRLRELLLNISHQDWGALGKALEASSEHFSSRSSVIILEALWEKEISTEVLFHLPSCLVHS